MVEEKIKLETNEFMRVPATESRHIKDYSHITEWLEEGLKVEDSDNGAGQKRYQGRFSFYRNTAKLLEMPRKLVKNLNVESNLANLPDYNVVNKSNKQTCIHMICSPCGGTGAGMFLDVANTIKHFIPEDCILYAHLLSPEFYIDKASPNDNIYPNTYAAFKEMDYLMDNDPNNKDSVNHKQWKPFYTKNKSYSYLIPADQSSDKSQTSFRLFDQVMFWDSENIVGMNKDLDSILTTMGAMFYQIINQPGKDIESAFNNAEPSHRSNDETGSKNLNFMSCGYSELILDRTDLIKLIKAKAIDFIINKYLHDKDKNCNKKDFYLQIDNMRLREDASMNKNELNDRLLSLSTCVLDQDSLLENIDLDEDTAGWVDGVGKGELSFYNRRWESSLPELEEGIINSSKELINKLYLSKISTWGGIGYCEEYFPFLSMYFESMVIELEKERINDKIGIDDSVLELNNKFKHIKDIEKAIWPFGKDAKLRESCGNYITTVQNQVNFTAEFTRKESAVRVYKSLISFVNEMTDSLNSLKNVFLASEKYITNRLVSLSNITKQDTESIVSIFPRISKYINISESDLQLGVFAENYLSKLNTVKSSKGVSDLVGNHIDALLDEYKEFKGDKNDDIPSFVTYHKRDAEEWLEYLRKNDPNGGFTELVSGLYSRSAVNCNFNTNGLVGGEGFEGLQNEQNIFITNKEKEDYSVMRTEEWKQNFTDVEEWKIVTNSMDDTKIGCLQIKGNFPANAISNMPLWKNKYKGLDEDNSINYHIDKNFLRVPDLFPEPFAKNAPAYFGLGAALGYIYCDGGSGYKIDTKSGSKNLFDRGGRNKTDRLRAFNYFKESIDFIKEIKERYEAEKRRDPQGIKEKLFKHFDILNLEIDRTHPEFENRRVYFAKLVDGIKHAEKDFIELERKSTANFVLTDGVMVTSDYHRKVRQADGTDVETYPIFELQKAGLEV
jgi:hypothetical protein